MDCHIASLGDYRPQAHRCQLGELASFFEVLRKDGLVDRSSTAMEARPG